MSVTVRYKRDKYDKNELRAAIIIEDRPFSTVTTECHAEARAHDEYRCAAGCGGEEKIQANMAPVTHPSVR